MQNFLQKLQENIDISPFFDSMTPVFFAPYFFIYDPHTLLSPHLPLAHPVDCFHRRHTFLGKSLRAPFPSTIHPSNNPPALRRCETIHSFIFWRDRFRADSRIYRHRNTCKNPHNHRSEHPRVLIEIISTLSYAIKKHRLLHIFHRPVIGHVWHDHDQFRKRLPIL